MTEFTKLMKNYLRSLIPYRKMSTTLRSVVRSKERIKASISAADLTLSPGIVLGADLGTQCGSQGKKSQILAFAYWKWLIGCSEGST